MEVVVVSAVRVVIDFVVRTWQRWARFEVAGCSDMAVAVVAEVVEHDIVTANGIANVEVVADNH